MISDLSCYIPPNPSIWQGRKDSLPGERYFQRIQCLDVRKEPIPKNVDTLMLGFCCDEGVRRNLGRVGARSGPDAIREQLAKLACHNTQNLADLGNIVCDDNDLEKTQSELSKLLSFAHQPGTQTIILGGGHEIAWPHFLGLSDHYPKLGIINFDAHFDIRPLSNNQGSSGTPFTQINTFCQDHNRSFDYCCLGIQPTANTSSLFERAHDWGINFLTAQQIQEESLAWQIAFLDRFLLSHDHIYLTICMDVFDASFAPGVSAPQALGITPWRAVPLLKYIQQSGKVVSVDIAELSPPLDEHHKTAKLASMLLTELLI